MRFLADAGISLKTADFLRRNGHEAVHVRELGMQRSPDRLLVDKAREEVEFAGCRFDEMNAHAYSEDQLVEQPAITLFVFQTTVIPSGPRMRQPND